MSQVRIAYAGGSVTERAAFLKIAGDDLAAVRFLDTAEALASLVARTTDLLLIDLGLASRDVLELLKTAISEHGPAGRVPVIVVAGCDANSRIQACLVRGADDYILLPFDEASPLLVRRRIASALHLHAWEPAQNGRFPETAALPPPAADGADQRFIPRELLDMLERTSLADVQLGDHMQREMTVFFSDIRDFTQLSERLTPQENFSFFASYLRNVTPIIRVRGGLIDKYLGDGFMALFPGGSADAVGAAVDLGRQITRYNRGRRMAGYEPIKTGTGLHRGTLMLGTVGAADQMQTTVIADSVNLASRIEGMTKTFGVNLLLSSTVVDNLPAGHHFRLRPLGAVRARGKTESVEIFECYDNDAQVMIEHKEKTGAQFASGMAAYRKGMHVSAGRIFSRLTQLCPEDTVATYFRDRCAQSAAGGRTSPWDGAEHLIAK